MGRVRARQRLRVKAARTGIVARSMGGAAQPQHTVSQAVDARQNSGLALRFQVDMDGKRAFLMTKSILHTNNE